MTVLVTGVTGKTGRCVAESLVTRGVGVRALVRDIERGKMATLGMGVELVLGDLDQPVMIAAASVGCEGMYLISSDSERQVDQEISVARTTIASGVQHIVKLSSSDAGQRPYAWSVAHAEIETAVMRMDAHYSFLRPHYFMQNYLSLLNVDIEGVITLEAPANDGEIGAIDTYDIGECAAALLDSGTSLQSHSLLTGPENISMNRVAEAFSNATGRKIRYVNLDVSDYQRELEENSPKSAADISGVYGEVRVGTMAVHTDNVERLSGKKPRSIDEFSETNAGMINAVIDTRAPR
ncbi:MAG: NmrA family NAD(P)-binding protein [Chloroflexi bacterium]|nr:NmrA family NAD(P)-binding protein [Chloroflexota bacterium]